MEQQNSYIERQFRWNLFEKFRHVFVLSGHSPVCFVHFMVLLFLNNNSIGNSPLKKSHDVMITMNGTFTHSNHFVDVSYCHHLVSTNNCFSIKVVSTVTQKLFVQFKIFTLFNLKLNAKFSDVFFHFFACNTFSGLLADMWDNYLYDTSRNWSVKNIME